MITFLTILQVLACLIMVAVVLLQPSKQSGAAFSASSNSLMGSSGGTTPLFKITMGCMAFVMVSALWVAHTKIADSKRSAVDDLTATTPPPAATSPAPVAPAPTTAPAAPAAPVTPAQ